MSEAFGELEKNAPLHLYYNTCISMHVVGDSCSDLANIRSKVRNTQTGYDECV